MTLTVPLVGMHFRPPAKQVLQVLPQGAPLRIEAEPDNPYDAKALRVMVPTSVIPVEQHEELARLMVGTGQDLEEVLQQELVWLGFIADSEGKVCLKAGRPGNGHVIAAAQSAMPGGVDWPEVRAKLGFFPDGAPAVVVDL